MKNKIIIILILVFYVNLCTSLTHLENKNFSVYKKGNCSFFDSLIFNLFKKEMNCFIERFITPEGVRIGLRKEKNYPFSNTIDIWKESALSFLEEIGYEIIEQKSFKEYEFIKSRVHLKEEKYIYGLAFQINPSDNDEIYIIEFFGEENHYKKYEKDILEYIESFYKKIYKKK